MYLSVILRGRPDSSQDSRSMLSTPACSILRSCFRAPNRKCCAPQFDVQGDRQGSFISRTILDIATRTIKCPSTHVPRTRKTSPSLLCLPRLLSSARPVMKRYSSINSVCYGSIVYRHIFAVWVHVQLDVTCSGRAHVSILRHLEQT